MGMSDRIESFILELLSNDDDWIELRRNELAGIFSCAPSQINYVLSTRFNEKNGYIIESRRGGGGYLRIRRVNIFNSDFRNSYLDFIGDEIDFQGAELIIKNLCLQKHILPETAEILITALSDRSLIVNQPLKNRIRSSILKNVIMKMEE